MSVSTRYQSWITQIPLPWMGRVGQKIWGAFAAVLGDFTLDWGQRANLEHCPEFASADAVALIADERQLDQGPNESTPAFATRLTHAYQAWKYAGRPFGILAALWAQGYTDVLLVQQNGLAYTLPGSPNWDSPNLVVTSLGANPLIQGSPPWWTIDENWAFCSRFEVCFLPTLPVSWSGGVPPASELAAIRGLIARWKPAKATCTNIVVVTQGRMLGWPVDSIANMYGARAVSYYSP